ncbi:uncharacterized protein Tco025E_06574 [Trypanosoma conorhini]|uniref:Uncharacterized protein n=1 Tax=Trypanosoma conorhini TaxID=83891 RepID=A0A422P1V4_9TRYP|nr:uncharacterized protein Tco025E_06574 [Trypanosoma conorhini]RNF11723.1 hypothetical protein Tco025E_06574 [Trypanosoma conorhini]
MSRREGGSVERSAGSRPEEVVATASTAKTHFVKSKFPDSVVHGIVATDDEEWRGKGLPCDVRMHGPSSSPAAEVTAELPQGTKKVASLLPTTVAVAPAGPSAKADIGCTAAKRPASLEGADRNGSALATPDNGLDYSELRSMERSRRCNILVRYRQGLERIIYTCFNGDV